MPLDERVEWTCLELYTWFWSWHLQVYKTETAKNEDNLKLGDKNYLKLWHGKKFEHIRAIQFTETINRKHDKKLFVK